MLLRDFYLLAPIKFTIFLAQLLGDRLPVGVLVGGQADALLGDRLLVNDRALLVEQDLVLLFPRDQWTLLAHLFIEHGRAICTAKDPRCDLCPLADICPSAFQFPRFKSNKA